MSIMKYAVSRVAVRLLLGTGALVLLMLVIMPLSGWGYDCVCIGWDATPGIGACGYIPHYSLLQRLFPK